MGALENSPVRVQFFTLRQRPQWWLRFVESHPAVPTIVAGSGLVFLMFMLAPGVVRPSGNGKTIDSLKAIVRSDAIVSQAVALRSAYHNLVPSEVRQYALELLFNPALYLVIPFLLLLEYLFPCDPAQSLISKGFLQDAIWFVATAPTRILVLSVASDLLRGLYERHLTFLTITSAIAWPRVLQVLAALTVTEFLFWISHVVRHKILTLWFFHAVHHSQEELNPFTEDRSHVIDRLSSSLVMFVPFYVFQVPNLYAVAIVSLYVSMHSRFVHANVKINLGWLGWVIASPQFHRVHHSADPAHVDKNFAGILSMFDYLFGTAYPSRDVYPKTGINDARFPAEETVQISRLPKNWLKQNIFPFAECFRRLVGVRPRRA
jgi:sterol desaturase/sphingolipid hydroxylase (fatty acid hydroxylase superfamily)